jgi:hypothetical protein
MPRVAYPLVPDAPQLAEFVAIQSGPAPEELRHPLLALVRSRGETLLDSIARAITVRTRFSHDITALTPNRPCQARDVKRNLRPLPPNRVAPSL